MEKLYKLTTSELGDFYVIAKDPTSAQKRLESELDKSNYGFSHERKVITIERLAEEIDYFPKDKMNFSSGCTLIINQ